MEAEALRGDVLEDSVAAKVGPFRLRVSGRELTQFVTVLLAISLLGWALYEHNQSQAQAHKELLESADAQTYILSVCLNRSEVMQVKCSKIDMDMPLALRRKLRE